MQTFLKEYGEVGNERNVLYYKVHFQKVDDDVQTILLN